MSDRAELHEALARAETLVDDRFGLVRQTIVHEVGPSDPPLFFATAQLASTRPFSDGQASVLNGGAGLDAPSATMGALGEAMERYGIGLYREAELIRGSFRELSKPAVDPRQLIFFAEEQYEWPHFPYARFDESRPISWVRGVSLIDGRERLVPAARVYTPYRAPQPRERILQSTSTGAACHVDRERATLSALYECIERDAVMIAWLNRLALPLIDPMTMGRAGLEETLERLTRHGLSARIFDATSDVGIPTALCIVYGPPATIPSLAVGAATHSTLAEASEKALIESAHTLYWIHTRSRENGLQRFRDDYSDVTSLDVHSLLYGDPRMRDKVEFFGLDAPAPVRAFKTGVQACQSESTNWTVAGELSRCLSAFRRLGLEAVVVDMTPRDVADLGFVVVRVVVTELHPIWGGHHVRCLGGRRVREVPLRLGYYDRARGTTDFNADPHPMP